MKYKDAQQAIKKLFDSEIKDKELQKRFDGFKADYKRSSDTLSDLVQRFNSSLRKRDKFTNLVLGALKAGTTINAEVVDKLNEMDEELNDLNEKISQVRSLVQHNEELIKGYEDYSDRKLYHYWRVFTAVGLTEQLLPDWKRQYKGIIF